jgi:hypothetical protein
MVKSWNTNMPYNQDEKCEIVFISTSHLWLYGVANGVLCGCMVGCV